MDKYYNLGINMGLKGEALQKFVFDTSKADEEKEKREEEREKRQHERDLKRLKAEQDLKESEFKEKEAERTHKLELTRIQANLRQLELEKGVKQDNSSIESQPPTMIRLPHMIPFDHEKDDMDCYLTRFERFSAAQNWDRSLWSSILANLLTGPALEVYSKMPQEDIDDYDKLKKALQQRYRLTADAFHLKFR